MLHIVLTFDSLSAKGAEDAALALVAAVPEKTMMIILIYYI